MLHTRALLLSPVDQVSLALCVVLLCLLLAMAWRLWKNARISPEERERRRRSTLARSGKMGDANIIELRDGYIFYMYDVRGARYIATQDVRSLEQLVPPDLSMGPVLVKYDPRNPANSVVVAEQWSGLRAATPYR